MKKLTHRHMEPAFLDLGLKCIKVANGKDTAYVWIGISKLNHKMVRISVAPYARDKKIPVGVLYQQVKQLGFQNIEEFLEYLDTIEQESEST